jgi:hypothetical protein
MSGIDHQQADMFNYLLPEQRVRKDHPLRVVRVMTDDILKSMLALFDANVFRKRAAVDSGGEAAEGTAFADALLGAQRAAADGRD